MATEWFISRDGRRQGPYSSAEIRRRARSGELRHDDLLWKEGMQQKRPAGESAKLFPLTVPASRPAAFGAESDPDFSLDDPQPVRRGILVGGGIALLAVLAVLIIAIWPAADVAENPAPAAAPQVTATNPDHGQASDPAPPAEVSPAPDPRQLAEPPAVSAPGVPDDF